MIMSVLSIFLFIQSRNPTHGTMLSIFTGNGPNLDSLSQMNLETSTFQSLPPSYACPKVCVLGGSRTCQVDNINLTLCISLPNSLNVCIYVVLAGICWPAIYSESYQIFNSAILNIKILSHSLFPQLL